MSHRTTRSQLLGLLASFGVVFVAAAAGALAARDAPVFYAQLVKPGWAPPAWAFGPIWSVLYVFMAVAAWLVWRGGETPARLVALRLFAAQLVANALWSWLFFAWRLGTVAFADVLVLLLLIVFTIAAFRRVSGAAALLLLPYLAWVCVATALTWSVWRANPTLFG